MNPDSPVPQPEQVAAFFEKHRTGLVTLVFTDLVDSTALLHQLGDQAGATFLRRRRQILRQVLHSLPEAEEIETAGDSFLLVFAKPSDAVRFALQSQARLRTFSLESGLKVQERMGIHLGEVVISEHETEVKAKDLYGIQLAACARVMSLAVGGQVLLTRGAFDSARQVLKGEDLPGVAALQWVSHGPYLLKGIEEPVEVCEVGEAGQGPLLAPKTSEKAQRQVRADEEPVLGWRPAVGQEVPNTRWVLEKKLGEGGFGEVWLGRHQTMKERRVFKFCFRADRVRSLKREMTLFRLIKERIGDHPNIVALREVYLEQPPFYVEEDYVAGDDLASWCQSQGGAENLPLGVKLEIVAQIGEALQAAHDAGVIHRDVKPANILVSSQRSEVSRQRSEGNDPIADLRSPTSDLRSLAAKLTDFGIGQVVSQEYLAGVTKAGFTQTILGSGSSQTGTQLYMAPELLAGKPASARSDLYSLGVVLYQLLVADFSRPVTTDWAKDIADPLLRDDLQHCFAGKPEDRFVGAGQLAKSLEALPERQAELKRREAERAALERAAYRRGMMRTASVAAGIVLVIAGLALVALLQSRRAKTEAAKATQAAAAEMQQRLAAQQSLYAANMNLAQQASAANNLGRAQALLEWHRPKAGERDLRDWEWRYLWRLCRSDELFTLGTHSNSVSAVAFSPDGGLLATAGHDGTARLWDMRTTNEIAALPHADAVIGVAFSPDGKTLATRCNDQKVRLWDLATRSETGLFSAPGEAGINLVLAFSPDGRILAIPEPEGIQLWNVPAKTRLRLLPEHSDYQHVVVFSPDGRTLASGVDDGTVRLWDVTGQSLVAGLSGHQGWIQTLAFAPDGRTLVSGSWDRTVRVWNVATRSEIAQLTNHAAWVSAVVFAPDGRALATASADQRIKVWDATTWQESTTLKGHLGEVWALAFASDGRSLVSGGKDGTVKFWSTTSKPRETNRVAFPTDTLSHQITVYSGVAVSPDGKNFAAVTQQGAVRVWNASTLQEMSLTLTKVPGATGIGVSPDPRWLAVGTSNGTVHLLDSAMNREVAKLTGHTNRVRALTFSPDGNILATGSQDRRVRLWDVATRREIATLAGHTKEIEALTFSQDGRTLASGSWDRTAKLWSIANRREVRTLTGHKKPVAGVAFSPDGTKLATASWDDTVKLWDVASQREIGTLTSHLMSYFSVIFSKDGRRLVAGTGDGAVKLWDSTTHQEVGTLRGHTGFVTTALFSDDNTLITASPNELIVWRAASRAEIEAAEAKEKAETRQPPEPADAKPLTQKKP